MSKAGATKALVDGKREAMALQAAVALRTEDGLMAKALRSYVARIDMRWRINGPSVELIAKLEDAAHEAWEKSAEITVQEAKLLRKFSNFIRFEARGGNETARLAVTESKKYVKALGLRGTLAYQTSNILIAHNVIYMARAPAGFNDGWYLDANILVSTCLTATLGELRKELAQPVLPDPAKMHQEGAD